MSNQIEDLIANIEQKFDDQFSKPEANQTNSKNSQGQENKIINEPSNNPESDQKAPPISQPINSEVAQKKSIVIEQDHGNEQEGEHENQHGNKNRKLDFGQEEPQDDHNQEAQQEQNQNKYKELSHKLETALKKISSSKKQFHTFNSATVTSDYLNRFDDYQRKREKDLQLKRKLQQEKKYHGLKSKPDINQKSKQIAQETSHRPIYERFENIIQDKKKKLEALNETKKVHEQEQYEKFLEEYKKHCKIQPQSCRDTDTYFHDMMAWKEKLDKERNQKLKQKEQKEKQGYTFKPQLNKRSVRMVKNQKRVPIQEREIERPKTEQSEYTFQPKINKRRIP